MNRRLPRLFFLGFLSLLLFACQQEPESTPVVEPDPTPSTLPTPLPPTPSVLPTITHTPQPSPTVEATSTTIVVATSTPTATLLPIAVPYTPGFTTYQLQPPSSQAVLTVLRQMTREQLAQYGQYESSLNYLSLGQFIEADLATFFADGFPEAIHLLGDDFFIEPLPVWFMPDVTEAHAHILQEGFVQYLHQQQHQLHAGETVETEILRFTANTMELDDDLLPEWVVQIDFRVWGSTIFVALDEIESGNYVRLPDSFPTLNGRYYSDGWTVIDISHDLTGDDHSEITIFNETYFSGGSTSITLWVLAWQNDQLVELQEIDMSYQRGSWPEYDFADYSGDGVEDIRITTTHFLRFGCQWDEIDLYSWDDLEPHFALQEGVAPATPLCNTSHGFERTLDLAERETLLRQVVQELTVNTAPSVDYLAFVRFHLAMLYAKEGQDDLAQHMLDALYELPLDAPLVALYTEIYESVNRSPLAMCRQLLQRSSEMMDSDMADFISELVVVGIGGDENKPYLPFVCPLRDIVRGRVISSAPLQATDPIVAMTNLGYSLTFTDTINLDADSDLEWIAILEPTAPHLVILDQTQAGWMVYWPGSKEFEHVFSPVINLTWTVKDMTDDGLNDLLVSLEYEDERRLGMTLKYQLFLIELGSGHFDYLDAEYPDQEMDLVELEPGFFVITTSQPVTAAAWKQLEGFNTEATSTYDYIRELVAAVLSPERPDTLPDDLIALINYLPPDDPEAHYLILQLTYMLGYTYEQEGREEEAIAAYLALIQQAPESPWSWLAWARLEPGE